MYVILTSRGKATMFKMSQKFIAENATANAISYRLPNKHYVPVPCVFLRRVPEVY
jgi:urate oxidase